jgi:predicted DNA-binding protein (UPF0251 family)
LPDPRRFDWLFRPQVRDEDAPLSAEARFAEALAQLPAAERSALALSELGGLDHDEIAQRLGTDRETAERLVSRARATVRTALAHRSRRLLSALLPLQSSWPSGFGAAARTFGAVAVGTVGIGATFDADRVQAGGGRSPAEAAAAPAPLVQPARATTRAAAAPRVTRMPTVRLAARPVASGRSAPIRRAPGPATPTSALPRPAPDTTADPEVPAAGSASRSDRPPRLRLVRVVAVARGQVRPDDVYGPVLHLPHVTQLVRDEVVGGVRTAKQDRPHQRVAVIAAQPGQAEEPGRDEHPRALDPDGPRIEIEGVEPRLGADEPLVRVSVAPAG